MKLGDIEDSKPFEPKPVGWYQVRVEKADPKKDRNGAGMVNLWLKIMEGPHAGSYLFRGFTLKMSGLCFMKPFLKAIGWTDDHELSENPEKKEEIMNPSADFIGTQLMVFCSHRTYNGKVQEDITEFQSLTTAGKEEIETAKSDEDIPF